MYITNDIENGIGSSDNVGLRSPVSQKYLAKNKSASTPIVARVEPKPDMAVSRGLLWTHGYMCYANILGAGNMQRERGRCHQEGNVHSVR